MLLLGSICRAVSHQAAELQGWAALDQTQSSLGTGIEGNRDDVMCEETGDEDKESCWRGAHKRPRCLRNDCCTGMVRNSLSWLSRMLSKCMCAGPAMGCSSVASMALRSTGKSCVGRRAEQGPSPGPQPPDPTSQPPVLGWPHGTAPNLPQPPGRPLSSWLNAVSGVKPFIN